MRCNIRLRTPVFREAVSLTSKITPSNIADSCQAKLDLVVIGLNKNALQTTVYCDKSWTWFAYLLYCFLRSGSHFNQFVTISNSNFKMSLLPYAFGNNGVVVDEKRQQNFQLTNPHCKVTAWLYWTQDVLVSIFIKKKQS